MRPLFHFTPPDNWTNDPNGLVYYDGEYHLFYQYNPYGKTWGHMSWGHAVSTDLLQWQHLPVALREYQDAATGDSTMIFSGTVVVDKNTSGLCNGPDCLVAIYTSHVHTKGEGLRQHQSLAFSNDKGRTWQRYEKNPVLDIQRKDFRDPKVFWYEPDEKWVMVLVVPDLYRVQFYESRNLTQWSLLSEFGPEGDTARIWECPDLYQLPVANESGKKKWVLSLSGSHPQGPRFVGMQYFVGEFDGKRFAADSAMQWPRYVDYGKDFYAGIVFNNIADQARVVMIGWVNNWAYANNIPATDYRGAMSLPRELSLIKEGSDYVLVQKPIREAEKLKQQSIEGLKDAVGSRMELQLELPATENSGIYVFANENEKTAIGFDAATQELYIDRTQSGAVDFHPDFSSVERVKVAPIDGKISLQIFLDHPIIEVFAQGGRAVVTDYAFAKGSELKVEPFGIGVKGKAWHLGLAK